MQVGKVAAAPLARAADDRGEDCARSVIAGEAGLAHAGAVVDHEGLDFIIGHSAQGARHWLVAEHRGLRYKSKRRE